MGKRNKIYLTITVIIVGTALAYWYFHITNPESAETTTSSEQSPVEKVKVITLVRGTIQEELIAYGTVITAIGKTRIFSVPFESQVQEVMVTAGQNVDANTPMIRISPSPDAILQLAQARAERDSAKSNLELTTEQTNLKLATRQDLLAAQLKYDAAHLNVTSLEQKGIDGEKIIRAESTGMISKIDIEQGQIVPAGSALIETIGLNQISVQLGVENEKIGFLRPGQEVQLFQVNAPQTKMIKGKIDLITHRVNPQTRMVNIFVTPEPDGNLLLDEYIEARMIIRSDQGFLVPRSALLPEQGSFIIFTVNAGHAEKHAVQVGLENPDQVEVLGEGLREGQQVIVEGNYELIENMAVEVVTK